jgi:hypothetical protein
LLLDRPLRDVAGQTGVPKSTLARHKLAHLPAALVLASDREVERHQRLFEEAQALRRSMSGWGAIRDEAAWLDVCEQAEADYESGRFLLTRLGAERHLDPQETATLLRLRQRLIRELSLSTALELMLLDMAVIAYANALRVQGWIGNLCLLVEHDLFADAGPTAKISRTSGRFERLAAEEDARRLRDDLLPALERASRTFNSAIKALREFRGAGVNVSIAQAGQVNVADQQLVVGPTEPPSAA